MVLPHRDRTAHARDVLVSQAGGPGFASTSVGYRGFIQFVLDPLLDRRDLVVMDNRGTGTSGAIRCPDLQNGVRSRADFLASVGACGRRLGAGADRYGSGTVAYDLEAARRALRIPQFDFYSASYGTADEQAYAVRFPAHVRAVVADSAIPVRDKEHGWLNDIDVGAAAQRRVSLTCRRAPTCAATHPRERALAFLAHRLRTHPVTGSARDDEGVVHRLRVDEVRLAAIALGDVQNPAELTAAADALRSGDTRPILRLAADSPLWPTGDGDPTEFSDGDNVAVFCNDLDPAWNRQDPAAVRRAKFRRALRRMPAADFAPFSKHAITTLYPPELCIRWPAPSHFVPAVPVGATAPQVPALLLSGDLDTTVPTSVSRHLRTVFPHATLVHVAGAGHNTTQWSPCAERLVVHFIRRLVPPPISCDKPAFVGPAVPAFPRTVASAAPAAPLPSDRSSTTDHRIVTAAVRTALDAWLRSFHIPGATGEGYGLRGGTFDFDYATFADHAVIRLRGSRFVRDVAVRGLTSLTYGTNAIHLHVRVVGPRGRHGVLAADGEFGFSAPFKTFTVTGTIGSRNVAVRVPAN